MKRVGRATVGLVGAAALMSVGLGVGAGIAQADDGGWGPPEHWCPGEQPVPATGNHVTDPLIWDGDNPPPKPAPPMGVYCDPGTFFQNCRIDNHP